jgi:polyisoprenyl-teichoic acid--peptidoglycan teichoic acid transferase
MYVKAMYNFASAPVGQLASYNGRTNILVMGKAGGIHDGPDLTDTMMLVSVSLTSPDVKIISIPRDTWIPEIRAKINSAYYWGNQKKPGDGITFAKAITQIVVGVPIQYGALIDFSGFKDVIDEIGGIEVDVENSFTDYYYPIAGRENDTCGGNDPEYMCRYETLSFTQGKLLMSGDMALKFVRSRHADGIEGTDVAREARQQKVIAAIKNKFSDKNTYTNIGKDLAISKVILKSIETDLDYPTATIVARRVYDSRNSINSYLIPPDFLINPPVSSRYDMQSVFTPRLGNGRWEEINKWVKSLL